MPRVREFKRENGWTYSIADLCDRPPGALSIRRIDPAGRHRADVILVTDDELEALIDVADDILERRDHEAP